MGSKNEILRLLETNREKIREFGVEEIGLFGSVARGNERDESDIDIVVRFEKPTFSSYMGLLFYLEDLLGKRVDLVEKDAIKPLIRRSILSETIYVQNI